MSARLILGRDAPTERRGHGMRRIVGSIIIGTVVMHALGFLFFDVPDTPTVTHGLLTGAIVGFLVWLGVDFAFYGYEDGWNLALTITAPMLAAIQMGAAGATIAAAQAHISTSSGARTGA